MSNEKNVKYLVSPKVNAMKNEINKSPYLHPLYAKSQLFYSSTIDYIMGKVNNLIYYFINKKFKLYNYILRYFLFYFIFVKNIKINL